MKAGPNKHAFVIFAVISIALVMSSIDSTIIAVGLPTMEEDLRANLAWVGWTLTAYTLAVTIIMPLAGKLSDEWGRKRLFLSAVALFTLSSIGCGLAPNVYVLIILRVVQAIGGGTFLPSATGIVADAFGERRRTAIGLFASIFSVGAVLGPNLGGIIIDHLSWRWMFFVNGPVGVALVPLGLRFLPRDVAQTARRRVDLVGAGLFAAALVSILYAMTVLANNAAEIGRPEVWALFAGGVALLGVFLRHEARTEYPMVELSLLRSRPFFAANLYNIMFGACLFGFFSFVPYYAVIAYGMSATESGAILTPRSVAMAVLSAIGAFLLIRFGYRLPMLIGLVLMSLSMLLMSFGLHDVSLAGWHIPNFALLGLILMLSGIGFGMSSPAANNAALDLVPDKVAAVTGLRGMFRQSGGVLGASLLILALSYFDDKAAGLQYIFLFLSFAVLLIIPVVFMIPDTARLRRQQETTGTAAPAPSKTAG